MNKVRQQFGKIKRWFSGSLSRKLLLSVFFACFALIIIMWLVVLFLEPIYVATAKMQMRQTLDGLAGAFDCIYETENATLTSYPKDCEKAMLSIPYVDYIAGEISEERLNLQYLRFDFCTPEEGNVEAYDPLSTRSLLQWGDRLTGTPVIGWEVQANRLHQEVFSRDDVYFAQAGTELYMGKTAADGGVSVLLVATIEHVPTMVRVATRIMLFSSLTLVVIAVLISLLIGRWYTKPLEKLSRATRKIAEGDYTVRVDATGNDEVAALSRSFNYMADRVEISIDLQKELIANISHDLRTPLTLIKGYAETVRDISGDDKAKRTEQLDVIVDEADRLSKLVDSVLEYSRVSSGNEVVQAVQFNLSQLCEELAERYDNMMSRQGYELDFKAPLRCEVSADPVLMERALQNLVSNAINHIGSDGYVGLHLYKTVQDMVRVEVVDHGPGIAEEDIPYLFERFYRSKKEAGKSGGTGLGLAVAKAVFEAHGFRYGVKSRLGHGAIFWFEAPLVK